MNTEKALVHTSLAFCTATQPTAIVLKSSRNGFNRDLTSITAWLQYANWVTAGSALNAHTPCMVLKNKIGR